MDTVTLNGILQAEYVYNYLGQQVIRRLIPSGQVIHSIFDLDGNRIAEYDYDAQAGTSSLIREYIWMGFVPVGVIENDITYQIKTDHIGRPVFANEATNITGAKAWEATYLPFGGVVATSGSPTNNRFPGQWFQMESGLYQNWMRDYDPTTGRYMQADPLGLVDGASVYGYARQNPGRYVDPRGENSIAIGGGFGGAVAGPIGAIIGGGIGAAILLNSIFDLIDPDAAFVDDFSEDCDDRKNCPKASPFQLAQANIFDAHDFKEEFVGQPVSHWDICACSDGAIIIRRQGQCGQTGPSVMTYARWK